MSKLKELAKLGHSIWLDGIRRSLITSGELKALIGDGIVGVIMNPLVLKKTIMGSCDYDEEIKNLMKVCKSYEAIYEQLIIGDVKMVSEELMPIYNTSLGKNGYVCLDVNPIAADDTERIIAEAKRLYIAVNQPNIMIKIPATQAGIPAIKALIGSGININAIFIFDIDTYKAVTKAYIEGLYKLDSNGPLVKGGHKIDRVASVAAFHIGQLDLVVNEKLENAGRKELQGKIAIANAKMVYEESQKIFSGPVWENLVKKGAQVQRLLWADTSHKNPQDPNSSYVDELIEPNTISSLPIYTLYSFLNYGIVGTTLSDLANARAQLELLSFVGIDLSIITQELKNNATDALHKAFESLIEAIGEKGRCISTGKKSYFVSLGQYQSSIDDSLQELKGENTVKRIWQYDYTVWKESPIEIVNRLDWLQSPEMMGEVVYDLSLFVDEIRNAGFTNALLLGMGGSSLAPEVFRFTFGVVKGYLELTVLDSTDPGAILEKERMLDLSKTLFIVSTKSGGTIETFSLMKYFYNRTANLIGLDRVGDNFVAITDKGSGLEATAKVLKFRRIFLNNPNIGGRYSVFSYFGLVPAALIGINLHLLLERATAMACNSEGCNCHVQGNNTSALLGVILGNMALNGRDKVTLIASPPIASFNAWVEQLIAESTGKEEMGILPVDKEPLGAPEDYANDRLFIYLRLEGDATYDEKLAALTSAGHPLVRFDLKDLYDLGGEFFRWEMATAVAGAILKINPFDQPDVESAKIQAHRMVEAYHEQGKLPEPEPVLQVEGIAVYSDFASESLTEAFQQFLSLSNPGENGVSGRSYVAIQAYLTPSSETDLALQKLQSRIQRKLKMATTIGYGPRFLHSTGQLHKGDAGNGLFIQITADTAEDIPIPDRVSNNVSSITFGVLKNAQALGDRQALINKGRKVIRFHLKFEVVSGLKKLADSV